MLSTFNFRAYSSIFLVMVFLTFTITIGVELLLKKNSIGILFFLIYCITLIPVILNEFRCKIISVTISNDKIRKSSYFAQDKIYDFMEIDGFEVVFVKGKFRNSENLHLIKNKTRIITLSQAYHKNYPELKAIICEKTKQLGLINDNKALPTICRLNSWRNIAN